MVDDGDYDSVSRWKWTYMRNKKNDYAYRAVKNKGKQKNILLHRQIMNFPDGMKVDHADGNGLNNQRSNLRLAPFGANNQNAIGQIGKTSKYKGVSWHKSAGRWRAVISDYKRARHIMASHSEEECARAYDKAAIEAFGDYALLNFPRSGRSAIRR